MKHFPDKGHTHRMVPIIMRIKELITKHFLIFII